MRSFRVLPQRLPVQSRANEHRTGERSGEADRQAIWDPAEVQRDSDAGAQETQRAGECQKGQGEPADAVQIAEIEQTAGDQTQVRRLFPEQGQESAGRCADWAGFRLRDRLHLSGRRRGRQYVGQGERLDDRTVAQRIAQLSASLWEQLRALALVAGDTRAHHQRAVEANRGGR